MPISCAVNSSLKVLASWTAARRSFKEGFMLSNKPSFLLWTKHYSWMLASSCLDPFFVILMSKLTWCKEELHHWLLKSIISSYDKLHFLVRYINNTAHSLDRHRRYACCSSTAAGTSSHLRISGSTLASSSLFNSASLATPISRVADTKPRPHLRVPKGSVDPRARIEKPSGY